MLNFDDYWLFFFQSSSSSVAWLATFKKKTPQCGSSFDLSAEKEGLFYDPLNSHSHSQMRRFASFYFPPSP